MGGNSTAIGNDTTASGEASTAMGFRTKASGNVSTAMGRETTASGEASTAMGDNSQAIGYGAVAIGSGGDPVDPSNYIDNGPIASGDFSTAMGSDTEASGDYSTAMGRSTIAASDYQTVVGKYNKKEENGNQLFIVGNGTDDSHRENAFVVDTDGKLHSAGNYPYSDIRLKENIKEIDNPLTKILNLKGVYYDWKPEEKKFRGYGRQIGFIAQEVEKVVPELVNTDKSPDSKGRYLKSVSYEKTVALLVEGIKEQEKEIKELKEENKKLLKRIEKLEAQK